MDKKGVTLLEVVLYTLIASIILISISSFATIFLSSRIKNQVTAEVEQQGVQVMQMISQAVRNARSITLPTVGTSGNMLILDVVNPIYNPTTFNVSGNSIFIAEGGGAPIPLTSSHIIASGFLFQNLSKPDTAGIVRTTFTLSYVNPDNRSEYDYSKTFYGSSSLRGNIAGGAPPVGCQGTPVSCSIFGDSSSCAGQSGCTWGTVWNCNGAVCDCTPIPDEPTCSVTDSCSWQIGAGSCGGTGDCRSMDGDQTSCESVTGCWWFGFFNMCFDDPEPDCAVIGNEPLCSTAGCTWTIPPETCAGSCTCANLTAEPICTQLGCLWGFTDSCSGTPDVCGTFGDQISCDGQAGCSWN